MKELRLGCYKFRLHRTLDGIPGWELKKLSAPGGPARNPAFTYVWLRQHGIAFSLSFRWDRARPVRYNLSQLEHPWMLRKLMEAYDDEVLAFPLDGLVKNFEKRQEAKDAT